LFDDDDPATAEAQRDSIVAPAKPSPSAQDKARSLRTGDGFPVHSFQSLLADLATIAKNRVRPKLPGAEPFDQITRPTPLPECVNSFGTLFSKNYCRSFSSCPD
jgi:hypothetical protein